MSWMDTEPVRGSYPGIEFVALPGAQRMIAGDRPVIPAPPMRHLFGVTPVDAGPGFSTFSMPASPWLQSWAGVFLASTCALVADAPLGGAIVSTLDVGAYGVTSELSMNFLRPATVESRELVARARLINAGRSLGLSEAVVTDAEGRVLAHTTSRYFLKRVRQLPAPTDLSRQAELPVYPTPDPYQRPVPSDLLIPPEILTSRSGLDLFRAIAAGTLPAAPFARLFGIRVADVDDGIASLAMRASKWLTSPARTIYGGVIAYYADAAMMIALATTLPAGISPAALDLKVNFLRPGLADDRDLIARGEVVHRGRSLAVTRAEIRNADGKQIAIATGSSMIVDRPWQSVTVADEPADNDE